MTSKGLRTRQRLNRERENILKALEIKEEYKGSVIWERVKCGKNRCRCNKGLGHGPYPYLHFYSRKTGKVQTKYLPKDVGMLVSCPKSELKENLLEIENELQFLGQHKEEPDEPEILEEKLPQVRCYNCSRLTDQLFCPTLGSYLSKDAITQDWECSDFQKKKRERGK